MPLKSRNRLAETKRPTIKEARPAGLFLGPADRDLLLTLYATRFLTVPQACRLLARAQPTVQQRLTRLYNHHYLNCQLWGFRRAYTLDTLGLEYVAVATGIPLEQRQRPRPVSPYFLDHYIAVADVYVALTLACRREGLTLTWRNEVEAADHYEYPAGVAQKLEPDALLTVVGTGMTSLLAFLEVDRATESWQKWAQKLRDYQAYFLSGRFVERRQVPPRVLVLVSVPDDRRLEALRTFTAERWNVRLAGEAVPLGLTVHPALTPQRILQLPWAGLAERSFRLQEPKEEPDAHL